MVKKRKKYATSIPGENQGSLFAIIKVKLFTTIRIWFTVSASFFQIQHFSKKKKNQFLCKIIHCHESNSHIANKRTWLPSPNPFSQSTTISGMNQFLLIHFTKSFIERSYIITKQDAGRFLSNRLNIPDLVLVKFCNSLTAKPSFELLRCMVKKPDHSRSHGY